MTEQTDTLPAPTPATPPDSAATTPPLAPQDSAPAAPTPPVRDDQPSALTRILESPATPLILGGLAIAAIIVAAAPPGAKPRP